ncbi:MAG TPA: VOC family protein [Spirochaetota bacterium]|nr:VOC family protein [Spirochaetota bacterium]
MEIFSNSIVFVKDIVKSKYFYESILGMKVLNDYDTIIFFENHLVIHAADSILKTIFKRKMFSSYRAQGRSNILLYFETNRLFEFYDQIADKVKIIHPIETQAWGQKVFRFYDPDRHMVEFGEPFRVDSLKS